MKISGAYIDGFGLFHDQTLCGLDRNLVLLYGHNEAGKSTLLGFIRSVLFGFPRANSRDSAYPPAAGGVHGGRIDLVTADGDAWSVSRKPGKAGGAVAVTGPDGRIHDKAVLDTLLGGISYEAFRSIMAFGLSELQTMETLSGEHISSAIYGAGLGTSMNAMPRALKQIRKRMDELFKNRASNPAINRLAGELDRVRKTLGEAALQAGRYDATVDGLSETDKAVAALREELSGCRRELQRYEGLERLWDEWVAYVRHRQALDELGPPVETFPEDGLEALEKLSEKRDRYEAGLRDLRSRHEQIETRLLGLPVEENLLARASDIASLVENRKAYLENVSKLPMAIRDAGMREDTVRQLLSRLGGEWREADLVDFDRSLFTRETIRGHQATLDALENKIIAFETLFGDKKADAGRATGDLLSAEKVLAGAGEMPPRRDPEPIRRLTQGRERMLDVLAEHRRLSADLADAAEELYRLRQAAGQKGPGKKWPAIVVAIAGVLGAGALVWFVRYNEAAMVLIATAGAAWAVRAHRRQRLQLHSNRQELVRREQRRVDDMSARLRELESIQQDYLQTAVAAGAVESVEMPGEAVLDAVDRLFSVLSEEDTRRAAVMEARRRLEEKQAAEAVARQALEKTLGELDVLETERRRARAAWAESCSRFGLSDTLSPATALEALDVIEEALGALQQRDRCRAEAQRLETQVSTYRAATRRVLSDVSWPATEDDELPRIVGELLARLEESRGNRRERETLGRQMAELDREIAAARKALETAQEAACRLLETAGLPDEAAFRKVGRLERERREHLAALRAAEANMRRMSGEVDTNVLKRQLETLTLAEISSRKEAADETVRRLEDDLSKLYTRRAEQKQILDTLIASDEVSRLRSREADLISDLAGSTRDWCRHALAEHLIGQARDLYEHKHQPEIIQNAGEIFSRMTDGRYRGVVSPLGESTLMAMDRNGERISPERLSRGTAEQLYLAVRFSYVRHQARKSDPLPVIMDDILVNFDPVRARKAAEAIRDLSASHQVLMFTCHPETVDVFRDIDPGLAVIMLDGGRIFPPEGSFDTEKIKTA